MIHCLYRYPRWNVGIQLLTSQRSSIILHCFLVPENKVLSTRKCHAYHHYVFYINY